MGRGKGFKGVVSIMRLHQDGSGKIDAEALGREDGIRKGNWVVERGVSSQIVAPHTKSSKIGGARC